MHAMRITPRLGGSKFASSYSKLLQESGLPPHLINPRETPEDFWADLLSLDIDREFLTERLRHLSKEECLGHVKPALNHLISACLNYARAAAYDDVRKSNSLETLSIIIRHVLAKNFAGWEVMEVFAGGVNQSDRVFMDLVSTVSEILASESTPARIRHQAVQISLTFMCSINQLSPGAYFLRLDLFPRIAAFIKSPDTDRFTFEAALLLSVLASYHKSDAARLNPYLLRIKETQDKDLFRKICRTANYAIDTTVRAYRTIADDSPPTLASTFGSVLTSLRPDRALASKPVDLPRDIFKSQPAEACVITLIIFELIHVNPTFYQILFEGASERDGGNGILPIPFTLLTLSSYLFAHATSSSSPRAIAYADLVLHILLALVEKDDVVAMLCAPSPLDIRICRQRPPVLPISHLPRAPVFALLDACVLWLRHNLHKRLKVSSYIIAVRICYRVIWYLHRERLRMNYHWQELWRAMLGLLDFLSNKIEALATTGGVETLAGEALTFLYLCLTQADSFLPTPGAVHEFVYELVRSSYILKKGLLQNLALPRAARSGRTVSFPSPPSALSYVTTVVEFYQTIIERANSHTAQDAMLVLAKEIDKDGLHELKGVQPPGSPQNHSTDVPSFMRHACVDILSLL